MITNKNIRQYYKFSEDLLELLTNLHLSYNPKSTIHIQQMIDENYLVPDMTISTNPVIQDISLKLHEMSKQALIIKEVFDSKFYYLYDALIYAINSENFIMLAENARALFELVGTLAYLSVETEKTAKNLKNTSSDKRFLIEFNDLVKTYNNLFYTSVFLESGRLVSKEDNELSSSKLFSKYIAKSVSTEQAKVLENDYNFLSDCVHPNLGSYLLVSSGFLKEDSNLYITEIGRNNMIEKLFASVHRLLNYRSDLETKFMLAAQTINNMYQMSLGNYEKVAQLFSPLAASKGKVKAVVGDGKSATTAINFPIARNIFEEVSLCMDYVEKKNLDRSSYQTEYVKDGWKFYSYNKGNKKIWFKVNSSIDVVSSGGINEYND